MTGHDDALLPCVITVANRVAQPDLVEPTARAHDLFQFGEAEARDRKAALRVLADERLTQKSVQGFAHRTESDAVARGSARSRHPVTVERWGVFELSIDGPAHGNPFVDVELTATFTLGNTAVQVGGFYDGDGRYRVRFMPESDGDWTYTTSSTARSIEQTCTI